MRSKLYFAVSLSAAVLAVVAISFRWPAHSSAFSGSLSSKQPVILELFTSEGCSSCPPADSLLEKLSADQPVDGVEILALEEHVDYWNHLGWTDSFSSSDFSRRQEQYADILPDGGVYTPQMIVDGVAQFIGNRTNEALQQVRWAASHPKARLLFTSVSAPNAHTRSFELRLDPSSAAPNISPLDLWIAVTEIGLHSSVTAGENSGHTLQHAPVVRFLHQQQSISIPFNAPIPFTLDLNHHWNLANLSVVAFLARPHSREILAAGSSPVTP